jgi:outer membrane protein assembly factor BamB
LFCPECGEKNQEDSKFCENCGAGLAAIQAQAPVSTSHESVSHAEFPKSGHARTIKNKATGGTTRKLFILGVFVVTLLLAAGCAAAIVSSRGGDDIDGNSANNNAANNDASREKSTQMTSDSNLALARGNPENTGAFDGGTIQPAGIQKWKFKTAYYVLSIPVVTNETVYVQTVGDHGLVGGKFYALDRETGTEKWAYEWANVGALAPAVADGMVLTGYADKTSRKSYMSAHDASTGLEVWKQELAGAPTTPIVSGDYVYFGTRMGDVLALDKKSGTRKWLSTVGGQVGSSPAVSDGIVLIGSNNGSLYALEAQTGLQKWSFKTSGEILSSPAVANNTVFCSSNDNSLYAIDAGTGQEKWRFTTGDHITSSPAVFDGTVYIGSYDKYLYAIDAATGQEKWRFNAGEKIWSSPVIADGVVYIGRAYEFVGASDGLLFALDPATGREKWRFKAGSKAGTPAVAKGIIYFGSDDGYLYALQ